MTHRISHQATIIRIEPGAIIVRLTDSVENCSGCSVKFLCGANSDDNRVVKIAVPASSRFTVGEQVIASIADAPITATFYAFLLPAIIGICGVVAVKRSGCSDGAAAMLALASIAGYYVMLYLNRRRLRKRFDWHIERRPTHN